MAIKSYTSRVPRNVGEKMVQAALAAIKEDLYTLPNRLDDVSYDIAAAAVGAGAWVEVAAKTAGGGLLSVACAAEADYTKCPPAGVGAAAGKRFLEVLGSGACADQDTLAALVPFMALARGRSAVTVGADVPPRVRAAVEVAEGLAGARFEAVRDEGAKTVTLSCVGIGCTAHAGGESNSSGSPSVTAGMTIDASE